MHGLNVSISIATFGMSLVRIAVSLISNTANSEE